MAPILDRLAAFYTANRAKPYVQGAARFGPAGYDCSGYVAAAYTYAGVTLPWSAPDASNRRNATSADAARWAEQHRDTLWPVTDHTYRPGDILVYGGINGYGNAGHIAIVATDPAWTWESSGSGHGVSSQRSHRLRWSHRIRIPALDTPTPPSEEDDVEHGLAVDIATRPGQPDAMYLLDRWGGIHPRGNAKPIPGPIPYWRGLDVARRLVIRDWDAPSGWTLDLRGALHAWGGAPVITDLPYWPGGKLVPIAET